MKREIKFRAWDAGKNEMEYFDLTSLYCRGEETGEYDFPDGLPIMQFTGLKDAKGVEVYEDDLIELKNFKHSIWRVIFHSGQFIGLNCFPEKTPYTRYKVTEEISVGATVIGNIYEDRAPRSYKGIDEKETPQKEI